MTIAHRSATAFAVVVLLTAGCSSQAERSEQPTPSSTATDQAEAAAHWSYEGGTGPEHWGSISDEYHECSSGSEQSPIDLTDPAETGLADIDFAYGEIPLAVFNNGHTIEVEAEQGHSIEFSGGTYELAQFHFHAGSEHTVDGRQLPMEMHLVHVSPDGDLAVVGVMLDVGAPNAALGPVFDHLPSEVGEEAETVDGESVDLAAVLPADHTSFHYEGSLTTPPCSEGVDWHVLSTPIEISEAQLDAFTELVDGNFRPIEPLGDRTLTELTDD